MLPPPWCRRGNAVSTAIWLPGSTRSNPRKTARMDLNKHEHAGYKSMINRILCSEYNMICHCLRWSISGGTDFISSSMSIQLQLVRICRRLSFIGTAQQHSMTPNRKSFFYLVCSVILHGIHHVSLDPSSIRPLLSYSLMNIHARCGSLGTSQLLTPTSASWPCSPSTCASTPSTARSTTPRSSSETAQQAKVCPTQDSS